MLTASLTNVMQYAETGPSTDMNGKTVGTLKFRSYDATVVAKHGGILRAIEYDNVTSGIDSLVDRLFSTSTKDNTTQDRLDGFLVDKHTYYYYLKETLKKTGTFGKMEHTTFAEKSLSGEKLSFGMLLKNRSDYHYLRTYIEDNWLHFDACQEIMVNGMVKRIERRRESALAQATDGFFFPIIKVSAILLAVVCCFGVIYEVKRKNYVRVCRQQPIIE